MSNNLKENILERKFVLLQPFPEMLESTFTIWIKHFYTEEGIRLSESKYFGGPYNDHTKYFIKKKDTDVLRYEEESITKEEFHNKLEKENNLRYIAKKRYMVNFGDDVWKIDWFQTPDHVLLLAQIEIFSEDNIVIPPFISDNMIIEVTDDPRFKNINLAKPLPKMVYHKKA